MEENGETYAIVVINLVKDRELVENHPNGEIAVGNS